MALCGGAGLGLAVAYLLSLLVAAAVKSRRPSPPAVPGEPLRLLVIVPAHDEEAVIKETLSSIAAVDYPPERVETIVVADNCNDRTAELAQGMGATVLERRDPSRPGKGHALRWALDRLQNERPDADGVVLVDADCQPTANLLTTLDARLRGGAEAVQANYVVANPDASTSAGLRFIGFALVNTIRPLGKSALGFSSGLFGTGMAFTRRFLDRQPWEAFSLVEDQEFHLRLVENGGHVEFAPEAAVSSPMPTAAGANESQQLRWEGGRGALVRRFVPRLAAKGLRKRDAEQLHAALELLVPPQSLLAAGNLGALAVSLAGRDRAGVVVSAANLLGQAVFVLGGLAVIRAPSEAYKALTGTPRLILQKIRIYAKVLSGRGPRRWIRTERPSDAPP